MSGNNIAIVGAGMAGMAAARVLAAAGYGVTVYDKGRRPGGRLAVRRADGFTFNYGCQFASARDAGFLELLGRNGAAWPAAGDARFAGVPDMATLAPVDGLSVEVNTHVSGLERSGDTWALRLRDAAVTPPSYFGPEGVADKKFDAVILAVPAPQARGLLETCGHEFAAALEPVRFAPCWALMLGFEGAVDGPEVLRDQEGAVSWVARENSRPGAAPAPVAYTVHAAADWSEAHLEDDPVEVATALIAAFARISGINALPVYAKTHRWRYALAARPLGEAFLWDGARRLGVCGDWCLAGRLEAAYLSGSGLGIRLAHDR
jgi:predicted NAD/FAD-dependent oxidoreductase